jgi:FkbM family methyltransferase
MGWIWRHPSNKGVRVRRVLRALWFQLYSRLLRRPMTTPLGHRSRIFAELHVSSSTRALYANPPDTPEMLVWMSWIQPGDLFIDVGANVGLYAIIALECGAEVVAVEPDPASVQRLKRNLALNGYPASIIEAALAEEAGIRAFTVGLDSTNRLSEGEPSPTTRTVLALTLDDILAGRSARGVKIDVEGAEWQVLRGGENALREGRIDLLQLEWNDCSRRNFGYERSELQNWLSSVGYELLAAGSDGVLRPLPSGPIDDVFARPIQ